MNSDDVNGRHDDSPVGLAWMILFAAILLLSGFLRLYRLDLISVTNDVALQGLTATAALSFEGWNWPLAGPPTGEVRSSAFLVTAVAIANLIWWHPCSGVLVVILFNLCALVLLLRLCARHFGHSVAAIAALLYASSPWAVLYARFLVPASCLAVFAVGLVHLSLRWLDEGGNKRLAVMVLLALVIPQIHFSGMSALLWMIVVLFLGRSRISYMSIAAGVLMGALVWAPWIAYYQMTGWNELASWIGQVFQDPEAHGRAFLQSVSHFQTMLHTSQFDYWFGAGPSSWPDFLAPWQHWILGAVGLLFLGLLLASLTGCLFGRCDRDTSLLWLWIVIPILLGTILRTGLRPENMLIAFPIPFVLVGIATMRFQKALGKRLHFLPVLVVTTAAFVHVAYLVRCAQFVDEGLTSSRGRYELSYRQRQAVINSIVRDADGVPVLLVGSFSGWYPAYQYVLLYEQTTAIDPDKPPEHPICYWIDEVPIDTEVNKVFWKENKERRINLIISESLRTPPDWVIERHWSIAETQVYRMRLVKKEPLR